MKFLYCLVVLVVFCQTCCQGDKDHDEDFIDPFDMINFDSVSKVMINKGNKDKEVKNQENKVTKDETIMKDERISEEKKVTNDEKVTSDKSAQSIPPASTTQSPPVTNKVRDDQKPPDRNPGSLLFRQFVKKLISYFQSKAPESTQEYHVWVKLSKDQYSVLQTFADGQSNIHDAQEILVSMITDVTKSNVGTAAKLSMWFEEKTGASLDNVLKMVTIMSLISMVLYMEIGLHISWRRRVTQLIMLAFVISIPMTWYELYQTAQINQQTVTMKEAPKECVQDMEKEDWLTFYTHAFKHIFTFQEDNCQKYYEHMLIDPLLKVTPTKAIAVTFVRFFLSPLKDIGTAFSEFMRALLIDLPVTLYPVAIVTLSMFFFLFLFMWFGYSIRLPFWVSIEPSHVVMVTGGGTTDNTQAIEDVQKQLEALVGSIENSETRMADELKRMGEIQTRSIEYTAAAMTTNVAPPTLQSAIVFNRSDISFESSSETEIKSPIPCSDDSFSVTEEVAVCQESVTKVMQPSGTTPVDNIGPNS
ncbi:chloride channel CLIC-like protein 1 isoform X1 [Mytilus trossulus]|uniref:chloride channel CLIC-like protein 1 isoform X1 n=2 Tax=Mytilus trossulus TaxID=6551 RepID=UPI00300793B8